MAEVSFLHLRRVVSMAQTSHAPPLLYSRISVVVSQGSTWCSCLVLEGERCQATVPVTLTWHRILVTPVPTWHLSVPVPLFSCIRGSQISRDRLWRLLTLCFVVCLQRCARPCWTCSTLGIHKQIALVRKNEAWYLQGVDPAAFIKPSNYLTADWSPGKT